MILRRYLGWLNFFFLVLLINLSFGQATYTPPPGSPMANGEHPRLFFNSSTITEIKDYINNYKSSLFQDWINEMDGAYSQSIDSKERNLLLLDAMGFAFLCYARDSGLFSNYSFTHTAGQYAEKAYQHAIEIYQRMQNDKEGNFREGHYDADITANNGGYLGLSLAAVYDWAYSKLTLPQRQLIADALIWQYDHRRNSTNIRVMPFLHNQGTHYAHEGAAGAIVLYGENDLGDNRKTKIKLMSDMIQWLWFERIFETGEYVFEGQAGWSEGYRYYNIAHLGVIWFASALSSAIDQNLIYNIKWLRYSPTYLWSAIDPWEIKGKETGTYFVRNDDTSLRRVTEGLAEQLWPTAHYLKGLDDKLAGFARWLVDYYDTDGLDWYDLRIHGLMYEFLWGSEDVPSVPPDTSFVPMHERYGQGEYTIKTDYTAQDATRLQINTHRFYIYHHSHLDFSSFNVQKYGNLLINAGCDKHIDGVRTNGQYNPIFHNQVVFWDGSNNQYEYNSTISDEADSYLDPEFQPGGDNHVGDVVAIKNLSDIYDYVEYDNTEAYHAEPRVSYKNRKFLYIHDPMEDNGYSNQEYLLVFDKIKTNPSSLIKRNLIWTSFKPSGVDDYWKQEGSNYWTGNPTIIDITNNYGNAHGRAFVKIVEPENYVVRLRGGPGNFFPDAVGNSMKISGKESDWVAYWAGSYRIEIEETIDSDSTIFLNVYQIGDANSLTNMVPVNRIETSTHVGVVINDDRVVFFNRTDNYLSGITYSFKSNKMVQHFIIGLEEGSYYIFVNGNQAPGNFIVDGNGVLYFENQGGGNFVISKSNNFVPPQNPKNLKVIK